MVYTVCLSDDITPCNMEGWVFHNGNTEYFVGYPDGRLLVRQGRKTLLAENAISTDP